MNKQELQRALRESADDLGTFVTRLSEVDFLYAPAGKWRAGEQLDHVRRSVQPLVWALRLPAFALRLFFGAANRASRSYEELVHKYQSKLNKAVTPPAAFRPQAIAFSEREKLNAAFKQTVERLAQSLEGWSENKLDRYILPHPLLGKITVREMMYFTVYHAEHHKNLIASYLADRHTKEG